MKDWIIAHPKQAFVVIVVAVWFLSELLQLLRDRLRLIQMAKRDRELSRRDEPEKKEGGDAMP